MRHVDAGYAEAIEAAERRRPADPAAHRRRVSRRGCSSATSRSSRRPPAARPAARRRARRGRGARGRVRPLRGRHDRGGGAHARPAGARRRRRRARRLAAAARSPGSSTATRMRRSAATASRSSRCAPAARATRSCTRAAAASSRPFARRAPPARTACARPSSATAAGCSATARPPSRPSRATGSTARRSSPRSRAIRAAGGIPTWLGAHAVPPEFDDADAYLDFALAEVLPEAARARRGGGRLPRAGRLRRCAGASLPRGVPRTRASHCACTATSSPSRARSRSPSSSSARSVDHLEATGPDGVRALAASDVVGVLLPASALFLGRPMPPARALVDAGAAVALATDFNPGSAFCESLPLVCSLAATQLTLSPAEALAACTVNAAHVLGASRPARAARARLPRRPRPARRARLALSRLPPRRRPRRRRRRRRRARRATLATHADEEAAAPRREGEAARVRDRLGRRRGERARGAARGGRRRPTRPAATAAKSQPAQKGKGRPQRGGRAARTPPAPSWQRAGKRALLLGAVVFALFYLSGGKSGNQPLSALALAALYTALFVPFTYAIDRFAYQRWQRRQEGGQQQGARRKR